MLEQQSRYDTARENGKEGNVEKEKFLFLFFIFSSDYCAVLINARHRPFLIPMHDVMRALKTQQLVHTSVFAARWRSCLSAEAALSDVRGPFGDAFLCRLGEEREERKGPCVMDVFSPTNHQVSRWVRVPSHPYCAISLCSRCLFVSQGRYRMIQCFVVKKDLIHEETGSVPPMKSS